MSTRTIDYDAFARDLEALRKEVLAQLGPEDLAHLLKLERWGRGASALGYATAWLAPNPLAMALISTGSMARWCILMHHVGHKGLDRVPGVPERYHSKHFAHGRRRLLDWFDWMLPEAWHHEHDVLHHFHTNEVADPDLVEENLQGLRAWSGPQALKYALVGFYALTWKLTYYAPNTFQILARARQRRASGARGNAQDARGPESLFSAFDLRTKLGREFWRRCVLPYGLGRFVVLPALYLPLGPWAAFSVWANSLGAELMTNLHTFLVIAPNHAGEDLPRFDRATSDRGEFFVRQVMSSTNFTTGGDVRDFLHGFLNYQIEHHVFPDLPPRQYQRIQPRVRAICEAHGVPYVQEPLWRRVKKTLDVMVGRGSMPRRATLSRAERRQA